MAEFPPVQLLDMPEDFEKDVLAAPTDDDNLPASLDGPLTYEAVGPCVVISPPSGGPHAGDAKYATVQPTPEAKQGDTVGVKASWSSEGEASTQTANTLLTPGGAVGGGFTEDPSRKIVR